MWCPSEVAGKGLMQEVDVLYCPQDLCSIEGGAVIEGRCGRSPCLNQPPGLLCFPFLCHRADVSVTL